VQAVDVPGLYSFEGAGMIKAIETNYNGYKFRSRMEARWAVFFDSQHIKYEYEMEGFDLGNGRRYLPDFWFPSFGAWGEVKFQPLEFDDSLNKALCLVGGKWTDEGLDTPLIELQGVPDFKFYRMFCITDIPKHLFDTSKGSLLSYGTGKQEVVILVKYIPLMLEIMNCNYHHFDCCIGYEKRDWFEEVLRDTDGYVFSVNAAKSARFEHGERP